MTQRSTSASLVLDRHDGYAHRVSLIRRSAHRASR